jgi:dTDP-4-dehydrorhamnose reductase
VLITGKDGQVGFALRRALADLGEVTSVGRSECDLGDPEAIRAAAATADPHIIVNAAAYTAVDRAQSEPELAHAINAIAPAILADEARRRGSLLVHYSTDYVFSGDAQGAQQENDPTEPKSVYGETKLAGEQAIRSAGCRHLIFRTSWVFGRHGGNFLKTILRLAQERDVLRIVADQTGAPTSAELIADVTAAILRQYMDRDGAIPFGTYHLAAAGATTWHGYAQFAVGLAASRGMRLRTAADQIAPIRTDEYPLPAARPANSRLDTHKLRNNFGIDLPSWEDGVTEVLEELIKK